MIYFISGHRDATTDEFVNNYVPVIDAALDTYDTVDFVVGDCEGIDKMAMDYIYKFTDAGLTIYHTNDRPRNTPLNLEVEETVKNGIDYVGKFPTEDARDLAMTKNSNFDIAFVRNNKWDSYTARNIMRRHTMLK